MRIARYSVNGGPDCIGVVREGRVSELDGVRSILDLIDGETAPSQSPEAVSLSDVALRSPIPRPDMNIICLGRNYREHADEMVRAGRDQQERPAFFTKAVTSVIGPFDTIPFDASLSAQLDWEVELAVIIGRTARNVRSSNALGHVFGYMVLNDVSARDLQYGYGGQFFYGKSLDGSCPIGPWIVTADEIPDPQTLTLRLRVNGETKQESSTERMILDVASIIETLSRAMTLLPGQIIATGTPPGVGYARNPPEFLKPGDRMASEIVEIGGLANQVTLVDSDGAPVS